MTHDPLCRRAKITEVFMEGCPECALIAKVREDEGNRYVGMKAHWDAGYAFGLSDAPIAVEAVDPPSESYVDWYPDDWYPKGKRLALDAVEALRRKENDEAG